MPKINTYKESKSAIRRESAEHDNAHHRLPKEITGGDYADRTIYARRAAEFQGFNNPMSMSPFEQQLVDREKQQRVDARDIYIKGIQGRDGGNRCDKYERTFEDAPESN
jgi:hypothetical protein